MPEYAAKVAAGNKISRCNRGLPRSALCIGCGICEHECPVTDEAAKGSAATRHHCEDCVAVPAEMRKILETPQQSRDAPGKPASRLQEKSVAPNPAKP